MAAPGGRGKGWTLAWALLSRRATGISICNLDGDGGPLELLMFWRGLHLVLVKEEWSKLRTDISQEIRDGVVPVHSVRSDEGTSGADQTWQIVGGAV